MLESLLKNKKFPSPLIIEGPSHKEWIQKVVDFALCEEGRACGSCRSCKQVQKGFHPDWLSLEGPIKVEDLREKLFQLRQKPFQAKYRVFSLSDFEDANHYVQNALLKTLEEPLTHWIILLGLNSRFAVLETIRSRCLLFRAPDKNTSVELSPTEQNIFSLIEDGSELELVSLMDSILKDRVKTKNLFGRLLLKASEESYPGHWVKLSPRMERSISELTRNLNPRILWDTIWAESYAERL